MEKLTFYRERPSPVKELYYPLYRYATFLSPFVLTTGISNSFFAGFIASLSVGSLFLHKGLRKYLLPIHNHFENGYRRYLLSKKVSKILRATMLNAGLGYKERKEIKKSDGRTVKIEKVTLPDIALKCDNYNYYMTARMLNGQTTAQWESKSTAFANSLCSDLVKFKVSRGEVTITLQHTPMNVNLVPHKYDDSASLNLGYTAGGLLKWSFNQHPHLLVIGVTSAGKSTFIRNLLVQFRKEWILKIVDGKEVEFTFLKEYGYDVVTSTNDFVRYIDNAVVEMDRRYKVMSEQRKNNYTDMDGIQPYFLLCDEWISLVESLSPKKKKDEEKAEREVFFEKLKKLTTKGRAAGVFVIAILQRPDTEFIHGMVRDMFTTKVVLRGSKTAFKMAFDDEGKDLVPLDKGEGYCMMDELKNFSFPNYEMETFVQDIAKRINEERIVGFYDENLEIEARLLSKTV